MKNIYHHLLPKLSNLISHVLNFESRSRNTPLGNIYKNLPMDNIHRHLWLLIETNYNNRHYV